jgi:oxaloacetate decarboxylase beta subunit
MIDAFISGLSSLVMGLGLLTIENIIMMAVGCVLLYLGIKKDYEPLLLVPIGFGAVLVNIPLAGMMAPDGLLRHFYDAGVMTEIFPCLIFVGIGAMTDFGPLLENPKILLLGAAGQFGIFLTLALALLLGFSQMDAVAIGIIGACDGPTSIYVTSKYAPHLLGAVSVAAYGYMSLVPLIQPPIMRILTTDRERKIRMEYPKKSASPALKILFPVVVTIVTCLIAPMGTPLMGMIMLGNLMRESGAVSRLTKASENEIANVVTLLLGLSIGATMEGAAFLKPQTLLILGLGFIAICLDTVAGVLFGKLMCLFTKGKINPLIGAAGISAYPMAARVVQAEGRKYDENNWLLMHAIGANTGGQIGSVMAAAIMLSVLKGMGIG